MKLKEFKRVLAVTMAISCVLPNTVYAAEPAVAVESETVDGIVDESTDSGSTSVETADNATTESDNSTGSVTTEGGTTESSSTNEGTTETPSTDEGATEIPNTDEGTTETPSTDEGTEEEPNVDNGESDKPDGGEVENPDTGDTDAPSTGEGTENPDTGDGIDVENPDTGEGGETDKPDTDEGSDNTDPEGGNETEEPGSEDTENPVTPTPEPTPEVTPNPTPEATPAPEETPTPEVTPEATPEPEETPETTQEPEQNTNNGTGSQHRVQTPVVSTIKDFRFYTIEKEYAFAKEDLSILEDTKDDARVIGTLPKDGMCFVMKDCSDGWTYVESEDVRGFVKSDKLYLNEEAQGVVDSLKQKAQEQTDKENEEIRKNIEERLKKEMKKNEGETDEAFTERFNAAVEEAYNKEKKPLIDFETLVQKATQVVSWQDNKALAYTRATTRTFLADKKFGLVDATALNVREGKGTDTRIVGLLPTNALVYILADADQEWIYIESGDVRGFVHTNYVKTGEEVDKEVAETGEENFPKVEAKVDFKEVSSLYYVRESVKEGQHSSKLREEIVNYAQQFVGNRYVWGGTDPVNGADCSGFVQSIYADFGYSLPRVAADQAYYGEKIAVEDAQPGDLIFYMNSEGHIYHVVMYAGDGKTVEAMSTARGITNSTVGGNACWATRIISEDDDLQSDEIVRYAENDEYGDYLGNFKLTFYCPCEICCGQWADGITATGTTAVEGRTIAVDPNVIPYGTEVIIGGRVYVAEDCGGAIKGNRIDVYVDSHQEALDLGVQYADVFIKK